MTEIGEIYVKDGKINITLKKGMAGPGPLLVDITLSESVADEVITRLKEEESNIKIEESEEEYDEMFPDEGTVLRKKNIKGRIKEIEDSIKY